MDDVDSKRICREPRILFTCGREPTYQRNLLLRNALSQCATLKFAESHSKTYPIRFLQIFGKFLSHPWKDCDLLFAGFLGQPIVPALRLFTRKPILMDAFISIFDTLSEDRKLLATDSFLARLAFELDKTSCMQANRLLCDTHAHAKYFSDTFGISPEKMDVVYVGCDEKTFYPVDLVPDQNRILFYGSYLPLHGIDVIVRAAGILSKTRPYRFRIIGDGMEMGAVKDIVDKLDVDNIELLPPVNIGQLPNEIAQAALTLGGHFGASEKAKRVIAGKTFQCLAMAKAVIVGDNPANGELLTHGSDSWFCKMNDPQALADAIDLLMHEPKLRDELGKNGRTTFQERASIAVINRQIEGIIRQMMAPS